MAIGKKTGGRRKGSRNKVTPVTRAFWQAFLDHNAPELQQLLDEVRYGIEIEKQMPDGQVVVGRLNADPGKAFDLILKASEFCLPKLGRTEVVGESGGPVVVEIRKFEEA